MQFSVRKKEKSKKAVIDCTVWRKKYISSNDKKRKTTKIVLTKANFLICVHDTHPHKVGFKG